MKEIDRLLKVIDRLRAPGGCPWDRAQTIETLRPGLLDEAYEVLSAINSLDAENLREELGDLLFGVLMLCRQAEAESSITLAEIARGIEEKIVRRHPHVFSDRKVDGVAEVLENWEEIKRGEKNRSRAKTLFEDRLRHLPALRRAQKIQSRARKVGFDWSEVSGVCDKISEELAEVKEAMAEGNRREVEKELGDLLFSVVNLVRFYELEAESCLHRMIERWIDRFQKMESLVKSRGKTLEASGFEELDRAWEEIAEREKKEAREEEKSS